MTTTNEFDQLERELESAFAVPVPELRFADVLSRRPLPMHNRRRGWRFASAGALAAGLVAAIAFLPGYFGGAKTVSAEELVNRSSAATAELSTSAQPYYLRALIEGKGSPIVVETWAFGAAGNRSETTMTTKDGADVSGQVATPTNYWMWNTAGGATRVAHIAGATDRVKDFNIPNDSLEGVLQDYIIEGCQEAVLDGSAKVAGRSAHVVQVRATPETCKRTAGRPETEKLALIVADIGSSTLWIDKETNIQLKVEQRDSNGGLVSRYAAEVFETGDEVDQSVLNYTAPAGATVIEAADYSEAKSALYGRK